MALSLSQEQCNTMAAEHNRRCASQEVLILDADNVPLANPTFLFDEPAYRKAGSLFWPDYWSSNWHNPGPVYDLLNLTNPWELNPDILTTESGQFVFNRSLNSACIAQY